VRAIRAALEIASAVRGLRGDWDIGGRLTLQVRIGIHTGLVVIGDLRSGAVVEQMSAVGDTPNVAARIQNLAEPGTVLVLLCHKPDSGPIESRT